MKTRYKNVTVSPDRHGKLRARFRKAGRKPVYMKNLPDTPGFEAELSALIADQPQIEIRCIPRSVHDLCTRYYQSADFKAKGGDDNRRHRRGIIESFRVEVGNDLVANFGFEHIEAILLARTEKRVNDKGRTVGGQVAARNLRKELRRLFAYAKKLKWIAANPVDEAEKIGANRLQGFYTWTEDDIAKYQARHPIGTKARLALEIILWTGQRRSDARLFGPKHIVRGKINYQAAKNGADLWLPVARDLRRAIDAMPSVGLSTYLVTDYGKPFTKDGFGNWFRDRCDEAGLPQCAAHGLRKAIARRMAQDRASDAEMMAVGGWRSTSEVRTYTEAVEQEALAEGVLHRIDERYSSGPGPENA
jgi:integrase